MQTKKYEKALRELKNIFVSPSPRQEEAQKFWDQACFLVKGKSLFVSVSCISLNVREIFLLLFCWCYYIEKTWFFILLALKFTKKHMNVHKWTFASEFFVFLLLFFCISFQSENCQIESAFVPIPGSKSFLKVDEDVAFVCKHALSNYCKDFTQIQVLQTKWPTKYAAQLKFTCSKSTTESFFKKSGKYVQR